jgi:hypothetical protein
VDRKPFIALVAVVVLGTAAGWLLRGTGGPPTAAPSPVAPDELDDQLVSFVYENLVRQAANDTARRCPMPNRQVSGLLKVSTREGVVVLEGWRWKTEPPGWTQDSRQCAESIFKEQSGAPIGVKVPAGREYELDVELTYPPPPPSDSR